MRRRRARRSTTLARAARPRRPARDRRLRHGLLVARLPPPAPGRHRSRSTGRSSPVGRRRRRPRRRSSARSCALARTPAARDDRRGHRGARPARRAPVARHAPGPGLPLRPAARPGRDHRAAVAAAAFPLTRPSGPAPIEPFDRRKRPRDNATKHRSSHRPTLVRRFDEPIATLLPLRLVVVSSLVAMAIVAGRVPGRPTPSTVVQLTTLNDSGVTGSVTLTTSATTGPRSTSRSTRRATWTCPPTSTRARAKTPFHSRSIPSRTS